MLPSQHTPSSQARPCCIGNVITVIISFLPSRVRHVTNTLISSTLVDAKLNPIQVYSTECLVIRPSLPTMGVLLTCPPTPPRAKQWGRSKLQACTNLNLAPSITDKPNGTLNPETFQARQVTRLQYRLLNRWLFSQASIWTRQDTRQFLDTENCTALATLLTKNYVSGICCWRG